MNENKKNKKSSVVLSILGVLSLILITSGVTYALFTYTKLGTTENTITAGTIKFLYEENTDVGKGIAITNAFPVSDATGKAYSTENYVFDFKVTAENSGNTAIPYEVTLRKKASSTLDEDIIKVYLTDRTGGTETDIVEPTLFSELTQTTVDVGAGVVEKTLTTESVGASTTSYEKAFRLRMWIDEDADFSATVYTYRNATSDKNITATEYAALGDSTGYEAIAYVNSTDNTALTATEYAALDATAQANYTAATELLVYPYNSESFIATVNVYSNVTTVSVNE